MKQFLYILAIICIIIWALSFFVFVIGVWSHTLLLIAVIAAVVAYKTSQN